jgi:hypothetical protein
VLAVISILSVAVGLADTWLHAVTSATVYSPMVWAAGETLSAPAVAYGTGFNDTACSWMNNAPRRSVNFCGQGSDGLWVLLDGSIPFTIRGWSISGNRSTDHLITTLDDEDQMAVVTRPAVPQNTTYTAHSFGLTATCVSLGSACTQNSIVDATGSTWNFSCPGADGFPLTSAGGYVLGVNRLVLLKAGTNVTSGVPLLSQQQNSNSFNALVELYYSAPDTIRFAGGSLKAPNDALVFANRAQTYTEVLLANCSFFAYDIVIQVDSQLKTTLVTKSEASDETTGRL